MSGRTNPLQVSRRARPRVRLLAVAVALLTGVGVGVPARAQEDPAERAAREIAEARDRANRAADAWAQAQSEADQLTLEIAQTEEEIARLEEQVSQLQADVEQAALDRFVSGSIGGLPLLSGLDAPSDQAQADVFAEIAADVSFEAFDDYDAAAEQLADTRARLEREREDAEDAQAYLEQVQAAAYAEIENVRSVEQQRLKDEAVRRALEAQQAEQRRRAEEQARQEQIRRQQQASSGGSSGDGGTSSGGSGGTGGGGGSYVDGITCPVAGPSAFGDTWGAPRSGGRRHEGVDMLGPTGTPLVAVVSGYARFSTNTLGGNAVSLTGNNGNRYYYAHLNAWEGTSRSVSQGEVIGYMGDTGNARGTPHLHFEIHPGGGAAVNPYPTVRAVC